MANPGLDNRLRQHSRRAGFIIGVSMLATIALCVGGFAVIYAKIDPYTRDFVNAATLTPTKAPTKTPKVSKSTGGSGQSASNTDQPTDTPVPAQTTSTPVPTQTPNG